VVSRKLPRGISWGISFFPNDIGHEVCSPKHLVTHDFEVVGLVIVDGDPQRAIFRQQSPDDIEPVAHQ
jgi:hypothetical protein